ncbi:hypothetical protein PpBr36_05321 [Pyricularia pennisetigena]|uniref:hypothetical protein n=1 Tax=Pyricularia pennisetigena TaxID=1578925 RepID=UPI001153CB36|nr:hypothetical protein PpBr36_05321 [Pyricularia pennisetigena]TLS26434.1 hypothetical protein PpBr36_05321 [Pyricularia pennisetigena]
MKTGDPLMARGKPSYNSALCGILLSCRARTGEACHLWASTFGNIADQAKERINGLSFDLWSVLDKITSQTPHDSELQGVLADVVKIIEQEDVTVWLDGDGKTPFLWSWDQLPGLGVYIRDFFNTRKLIIKLPVYVYLLTQDAAENGWSSRQMAQRRNYDSFLASLMAVWEFREALEGRTGSSNEGSKVLQVPTMQTSLCMRVFDHLRDLAAQEETPEHMTRFHKPGLLCESQKISGFGLSRWQFWKQRLRQIRDEQLDELGLIKRWYLSSMKRLVQWTPSSERRGRLRATIGRNCSSPGRMRSRRN